jgi:hypothetical protein
VQLFLPEPGPSGLDKIAREAVADEDFMSSLKTFNGREERSSEITAPEDAKLQTNAAEIFDAFRP